MNYKVAIAMFGAYAAMVFIALSPSNGMIKERLEIGAIDILLGLFSCGVGSIFFSAYLKSKKKELLFFGLSGVAFAANRALHVHTLQLSWWFWPPEATAIGQILVAITAILGYWFVVAALWRVSK